MIAKHVSVALLLAVSAPASAHSFGRLYNLPVPFWLYAYGAAAALLLSFLVVAYFLSTPRAPAGRERDITESSVIRALRRLRLVTLGKILSVGGLLLCIVSGLIGSGNPYSNINMTLFWIVFVLGLTYLTALIGDVFALINPWRVLADALARVWPRYDSGMFDYPAHWNHWPALAFYTGFIWIELYGYTRPFSLAVILAGYSALNLIGAGVIGRGAWFGRCEFFSVLLRLIATLSPLRIDAPRRRVWLRAPFIGALREPAGSVGVLMFVLFMLSSTAFDGLRDTVPWINFFWRDVYGLLKPLVGDNPVQVYPRLRQLYLIWQAAALLLSPWLYLALYLTALALSERIARSGYSLRALALRFAYTLLPIALVYNVTHYYTLLLTQGTQIARLLSDPFGWGWNLFGTAGWLAAPIIPNAGTVWHTQVALIVLGHMVSVYLAHVEALTIFPTPRRALLSQLTMLLLMMAFTTIGLWILAQPIQTGG